MNKFINDKILSLEKFDDEFLSLISTIKNSNDNEKIINSISKFRNLESEICEIINSPYFDFGSRNLDEILKIYGKDEILALVLFIKFSKIMPTELKSYHIKSENFKTISLMRNALMFEWLKSMPNADKSLLSAIILAEFGRIYIDEYLVHVKKESAFYKEIKHCIFPSDFNDVEREFSGVDREIVGGALLGYFGLNEIAAVVKNSNKIDEADLEIKRSCAILSVTKTAVNIYHRLDDLSLDNTLRLLDEYSFEQESFILAAQKVKH